MKDARYPLWMRLENYLMWFPLAARGLRKLVHQEPSVPRPPAGSRVIAMSAIPGRLALADLLCGVLHREDRFELYLTPQASFFCYRLRYSRALGDVYFVQSRHCTTMAEVDAFFGHRWRSGRFFTYAENAKQIIQSATR